MIKSEQSVFRRIDWWIIILYILFVAAGWVAICGASYDFDLHALFTSGSRPVMQLIWISAALLIGIIILFIEKDVFELSAPFIYTLFILLLILTIFVAPDIKGSRSWLVIGSLRLQPAEFAKVGTALMLAWQFDKYDFRLRDIRSYLITFGLVLLPLLLIVLQHETGSALVFTAFFLALFREGFSGIFLGLASCAVLFFITALKLDGVMFFGQTPADLWLVTLLIVAGVVLLIFLYCKRIGVFVRYYLPASLLIPYLTAFSLSYFFPVNYTWANYAVLIALVLWLFARRLSTGRLSYLLIAGFVFLSVGYLQSVDYVFEKILQPHQQIRIKIALGIEQDLRGGGYNVDQSKIAIGSGGITGKGFLEGTQTKLKYVPEQDTDFIFCTIGEERGFIGSALVIIAFVALILRIIWIAERQTSAFGRVYAYCVASIFLFHLTINIGMVTGLIPVIGIPLPFFSYGGSSLWGFTFLLFILLSIDARR